MSDTVKSNSTIYKADVVVVGAGLSGLSAAYKLLRQAPGLEVIVIEAKDRIGGRTITQELTAANGRDFWELGGQWVGSCQPHIMQLLAELNLKTYEQYTKGTKFMFLRDNTIRTYKSTIPSLGVAATVDLGLFMFKVERMIRQVSIDDPSACPNAEKWDAITVEAFLQQSLWTQGAKDAVDAAIRTIFGTECSQISMLYFLAYASAAGSLQQILEATPGSAQEFKVEGGSQGICRKLVERIGSEKIWLSEPASSIVQNSKEVIVKLKSGKSIHCGRCIMATPPTETLRIEFNPPLPTEKVELWKRMPVGHIIKTIVTYEKAFWRDKGFSGEIVATEGNLMECENQPLGLVYDATSANGNPALVIFISGKPATIWGNVSFEERQAAVKKSLSMFFGPECMSPLDYAEKDWSKEVYNGGCPVYTVTPGVMSYFASGMRDSFERIDFAGTESATVWCGFLNGAVQSGYRAAAKVLYHIRPQLLQKEDSKELSVFKRPVKKAPIKQRFGLLVYVVVALLVCLLGYSMPEFYQNA